MHDSSTPRETLRHRPRRECHDRKVLMVCSDLSCRAGSEGQRRPADAEPQRVHRAHRDTSMRDWLLPRSFVDTVAQTWREGLEIAEAALEAHALHMGPP